MRLLVSIVLLMSFSAYGQRVKENIKQKGAQSAPSDRPAKPEKPVKPIRR